MARLRGGSGKSGGRLPRSRPSPEPNIIQRPELLRRLSTRLGIRQAHVAPALNEGVQPVVILDDLSQDPATTYKKAYWQWQGALLAVAGVSYAGCFLLNPRDSLVDCRVTRITVSHSGSSILGTVGIRTALFMGLQTVGGAFDEGAGTQGKKAQRITNAEITSGGISTPFVGLPMVRGTTIAAGAVAPLPQYGAAFLPNAGGYPFDWDWENQRLIVQPGQFLLLISEEIGDDGVEFFTTWFWEEDPLTR